MSCWRLWLGAGIDEVLLIAGDATPPHGSYSSAVELLPVIHEHPQRPQAIGIGGYPEGHPLVDTDTLAKALEEKSQFADYVTTQLCFDPDALLTWIGATREAGVALPVVVGVPGLVDRRKLLEISMRVGVGPSLRFLRKQRRLRDLFRLSASSADSLYDAIVPHLGDPELDIAGIHYFTFNRLLKTWRWEREKQSATNSIGSLIHTEVTPR